MKKLGTYRYQHTISTYPRLVSERLSVRVEVLEEKGASMKVRLLGLHADGRPANSIMRVKAKSVQLDDVKPAAPLKDIRLPYKD